MTATRLSRGRPSKAPPELAAEMLQSDPTHQSAELLDDLVVFCRRYVVMSDL